MKKRLLTLSLILVMTLSACSSPNSQSSRQTPEPTPSNTPGESVPPASGAPEANEPDLSEKMTITVTRRGNVRDVSKEDLFAPFLEEKFNVVLDITDINASDYVTRMNLMFASGEATDISLAHRPAFMLNEWIQADYLRGFTLEEVQEKLPNFISHYEADAWPVVWENIVYSDDKSYYLPGRRAQSVNMAWMYREDLFKEYGLSFPETTDELFDTLVTLKEKTGKIPLVAANAGAPIWAFTGLLLPFGIPELAASEISYVNPKTGEFVPYAFSTDDFRRHISFISKLYKNDLIWKEFSTGTVEQANKLQSQGNHMIMWGYPGKVDTDYNPLSQTENPNASWAWADLMITEDPANGHFFKREPYFLADGAGFNSEIDEEKVDRLLYMLNWFYSDEGMVFSTYGIEGATYEKQGENYVFMDQMRNPTKSEGDILENYGFLPVAPQHQNQNDYYQPYLADLANTFIDRENYYFFIKPIQKFTEEESSELADIETNLSQTLNEFYSRFIMGQLDVNNDGEWNNYISTMNRLGLEQVVQIRTDAYNRSK